MSDHGSDEDDLPDISYVRGNITNVQTSRFTVVTAQNGPQKDVLASPFSAVGLELAPLKTTNDFILMLDRLHVPGPLTILEALDSRHYIAKGGQFTVYRNEVLDDSDCSERTWLDRVAVKRCDFEHEENRTLDLSSPRYRIQVQNMQREVAALQDIRLKNHPNIVKLIGYGIDLRSWHETPFLVMPLALGDLRNILEVEKPPEVVHQMCLDVGYGLDAIHDCGLIHGDLKPENVLVFATEDESIPLIAKLADFGLSMDEISGSHGGSVLISGYSPGWAAPEVSRCYSEQSPVSIEDLMRFDCFSYGLVILSSACFHGQVPPSVAAYSTPSALKSTLSTVPSPFRQILGTALSALLHCNEAACPSRVGGLLIDETPACLIWVRYRDEFESWKTGQRSELSTTYAHSWTLPSLASLLFRGLEKSYRTYHETLTGGQLLAMFLLRSISDITNPNKTLQIEMLLKAARKGFVPAQGVAQRVISSYDMEAFAQISTGEAEEWLKNAVSTGLCITDFEREIMAPHDVKTCRTEFRNDSGYNQFYSPVVRIGSESSIDERLTNISLDGKQADAYKNNLAHRLAAYGKIRELRALLDSKSLSVNEQNVFGETALIKACLAGHSEAVLLLCEKGADASIGTTGRKDVCLHWLFNFEGTNAQRVADALIKAGADPDLNLLGRSSLVNYHFPFRWPPGTPLHWAVVAHNTDAVGTLIFHGAVPVIRNGYDPYKADKNVRQLHSHGTAEQGEFSETPETCLGLNSIDLAVADHNWKVLETISSCYKGRTTDLFGVDEEGYSPFHRLSLNRISNTVTGLRFWHPAFKGDIESRKQNIRRTVQKLKAMGGDIDQLTGSPKQPGLSGAKGGMTALMIAVTKSDVEVVDILCQEGANVNLLNRCGRTALIFMQDLNVSGASPPGSIAAIVRSLVSYGADVHYESPDHVTPLLCAASSGDLNAVQILADNGVSLTDNTEGVLAVAHMFVDMRHSKNMDHSNMSVEDSERRETDLACFLQKYVAPAARSNSLLVGDKGRTLLHSCGTAALFACVRVLVEAGASVNPVESAGTQTFVGGYTIGQYDKADQSKVLGTPLDVVELTERIFEVSRSDRLSREKVDYIFQKLKSIREFLVEHGGKRSSEL